MGLGRKWVLLTTLRLGNDGKWKCYGAFLVSARAYV
jgi:hypothetical protein